MDAISEARLQSVCPALADKVEKMAVIAYDADFRITQGLRTWDEQAKLYAQGRTLPGKIITNADAGHSWHNFGLAIDIVPDNLELAGFQADWNIEHPVWKRLIIIGESVGLASGSEWRTFKDWPHFQLTGKFPVSPTDEVRQIFKDGGLQAVWKAAGLDVTT